MALLLGCDSLLVCSSCPAIRPPLLAPALPPNCRGSQIWLCLGGACGTAAELCDMLESCTCMASPDIRNMTAASTAEPGRA